jgi:group I intron endonuclease
MYIYTIKNLVNGKMYVGQTVQANAKMRWYAHLGYARKGHKSHLYDSIRKHGVEKFLWEIVDQANTVEELNELETVWADKLRAQGIILYNNRETGSNKKHSVESIEKMRKVHTLRHANNVIGGWKRKDGGAMLGKSHPGKGKKRTPGQIKRMKDGQQEMLNSEKGVEYRQKQSENSKRIWAERKALQEVN